MIYTTISDMWFSMLGQVLECGYRQDIERGSYENESWRIQLPFAVGRILYPIVDYVPSVPQGCPPPTTKEYVRDYFLSKIVGAEEKAINEEYTYAERIVDQLSDTIKMLLETPKTNQANITVGRPEDIFLKDPSCLKNIDFKVSNGKLEITTFWRSNDLWAAFPPNLGALALLQEMVAEAACLDTGPMNYASSGLHLYDYQIPFAEAKLGYGK